jgi:hypothetical protein
MEGKSAERVSTPITLQAKHVSVTTDRSIFEWINELFRKLSDYLAVRLNRSSPYGPTPLFFMSSKVACCSNVKPAFGLFSNFSLPFLAC